MKKVLPIAAVLFAMSGISQNSIFLNNSGLGNQALQSQNVQVFASNVLVNNSRASNSNKPLRANANPQVQIQRATNVNSSQRSQVRRRATHHTNANISNPVQTNIINVAENNMNNDIQLQGNFSQQINDNLGNAFGNENMIEQIASANIPAIQVGTGSLDLNLDINMPKLKLPSMKLASHKSVSASHRKKYLFKNKLAKMNRKMTGKLSLRKKLKIKVDNCFKF